MSAGIAVALVVLDPQIAPTVEASDRTPRFTSLASELERTAGVSELENRLVVGGNTVNIDCSGGRAARAIRDPNKLKFAGPV